MQIGKLGTANLAANSDTIVYSANATEQTCVVFLTNRNASDTTVNVAIGTGTSPAAKNYIAFANVIPANGTLKLTDIAMSVNEKMFVRSDLADVSVRVNGL